MTGLALRHDLSKHASSKLQVGSPFWTRWNHERRRVGQERWPSELDIPARGGEHCLARPPNSAIHSAAGRGEFCRGARGVAGVRSGQGARACHAVQEGTSVPSTYLTQYFPGRFVEAVVPSLGEIPHHHTPPHAPCYMCAHSENPASSSLK